MLQYILNIACGCMYRQEISQKGQDVPSSGNSLSGRTIEWVSQLMQDGPTALSFLKETLVLSTELGEAMVSYGIPVIGVYGSGEFFRILDWERLFSGKVCFPLVKEILRHHSQLTYPLELPTQDKVRQLPDIDVVIILAEDPKEAELQDLLSRSWVRGRFRPLYYDGQGILDGFPQALPLDIAAVPLGVFMHTLENLDLQNPKFYSLLPIHLLRSPLGPKNSKTVLNFLADTLVSLAVPLWWNPEFSDCYKFYKERLIRFYEEHTFQEYLSRIGFSRWWREYYPRLYQDYGVQRAFWVRWESSRAGNIPSFVDITSRYLSHNDHVVEGQTISPPEFLGFSVLGRDMFGIHPKGGSKYEIFTVSRGGETAKLFVKRLLFPYRAGDSRYEPNISSLLLANNIPTTRVLACLDQSVGWSGTPCIVSELLVDEAGKPLPCAANLYKKMAEEEKASLLEFMVETLVKMHSITQEEGEAYGITRTTETPIKQYSESHLQEAFREGYLNENQKEVSLAALKEADPSLVFIHKDFTLDQILINPRTKSEHHIIDFESAGFYPIAVEFMNILRTTLLQLEIEADYFFELYCQKSGRTRDYIDLQLASYGIVWAYKLWVRGKDLNNEAFIKFAEDFRDKFLTS